MGMNISKGQKADLTKNNAGLRSVLVGMGWQANSAIDLDTAAFLLDAGGKVAGDADFVFYGNACHASGAVEHIAAPAGGDKQQVRVDLAAVPASVEKIAVTATIYDADARRQNFSQVAGAYVRVLDATSGRVVRAEEIRGFVMAQALTDDALIVQTSDFPYPGADNVIAGPNGSDAATGTDDAGGAGSTLTSFPLADPQAPPTTGSTPLWLLGATHDSLILGAVRIDPQCLEGNCLGYRAALATASGQVTGRIDGVYAVHPSGLLERFTGGEADDDFLTRAAQSQNPNLTRGTPDPDEDLSRRQAWVALGRELLDPASGATADITGFTLSCAPTASGWITTRWRPAWSERDRGPAFTPQTAGWMDAPGPVSTEPIMMLSRDGPQRDSSTFAVSLTRTALADRPA